MKVIEAVKKFFIKRKKSILQLLGSIGLLAVSAGIGIYIGLKETNGLEKYVNMAYEYVQTNNGVAIYQNADMVDNDFINEYFFEEMAFDYFGEIDADKLELDDFYDEDGKGVAEFIYTNESGKEVKYEIHFSELAEKTYVFFNKWKFNIDNYIIRECEITAPQGFEVYVDGVQLLEDITEFSVDEEAGTVTYKIPRLFRGEHTIYIKGDNVEVVETTVQWEKNKESYVLGTEELTLELAQRDGIKSSAESIVQLMYKAALNEEGIEGLKPYFKQDEELIAKVQAIYDQMLLAINPDDGSSLMSMSIIEFKDPQFEYTYPLNVNYSVTYDCSFNAREAWGETGGVREQYEGTTSSTAAFHYMWNGENWLCDSIEMQCIDYSKKEEPEE